MHHEQTGDSSTPHFHKRPTIEKASCEYIQIVNEALVGPQNRETFLRGMAVVVCCGPPNMGYIS